MTAPSASQLFLNSAVLEDSSEHNPYFEYFMHASGKGGGIDPHYQNRIGPIYSQNPYYQKGYGFLGGQRGKYGHGIGSALSSLWRMAFPIIKKGAQALGTAAADVASNIASDVLEGKDFKQSAIEHAKTKGLELIKELPSNLNKTPAIIEDKVIPAPDLVAPTPTQFRRINRKRAPGRRVNVAKRAKYPALRHFK